MITILCCFGLLILFATYEMWRILDHQAQRAKLDAQIALLYTDRAAFSEKWFDAEKVVTRLGEDLEIYKDLFESEAGDLADERAKNHWLIKAGNELAASKGRPKAAHRKAWEALVNGTDG